MPADGTAAAAVLIRPATAADFAAALQLGREMYAESDYRDEPFSDVLVMEQLPKLAASSGVFFAVAEAPDGQLIGFMVATVARRFFNHRCYTDEFLTYVRPEWRGRGVFEAMVAKWENWARASGLTSTFFGCLTDWARPGKMTALMQRLGYEEIGRAYRKVLR